MESFKNFKFRNEASFTSSEDKKLINQTREELSIFAKNEQKEAEENKIDLESLFGSNIYEKINGVDNLIAKEMESREVKDVKPVPNFLLESNFISRGGAAESALSHIRTSERVFNKDFPELFRQIEFLQLHIHESYHNIAMVSADLTKKSSIDIQANINERGASYRSSNLFEEGLAYDFEKTVWEQVKQTGIFSEEELAQYYSTISTIINSEENILEPEAINLLKRHNSEKSFTHVNDDYVYSEHVIDYLKEEIPNFLMLVEKARTQRRPLDLVRALNSRFGEGTYDKLTLAIPALADQMLFVLQESNSTLSQEEHDFYKEEYDLLVPWIEKENKRLKEVGNKPLSIPTFESFVMSEKLQNRNKKEK